MTMMSDQLAADFAAWKSLHGELMGVVGDALNRSDYTTAAEGLERIAASAAKIGVRCRAVDERIKAKREAKRG